jgi:O-antigen ligase
MSAVARATAWADRAARWSGIALGFSIPISTALGSVLSAIVLAAWLASGRYREKSVAIKRNPVALAALMLFAILMIGVFYGDASAKEAGRFLTKYADLLLIPVLVTLFRGADARRAGIYALAGALLATVLFSYALRAGMPRPGWFVEDLFFHVPFKHKLTHSVLVAFAAFLLFQLALSARTPRARLGWLAASLLSVINVAFVVPGGTGYVVFGTLLLYAGYALRGYLGLLAMMVVGALFAVLIYQASDSARERVDRALQEYSAWTTGDPSLAMAPRPGVEQSSIGQRLTFYRETLQIIRDHPLVGVGTGGFPKAYAETVRECGPFEVRNPHNEYLLVMAQNGVVGLLLLLYLFWRTWQLAPRLATPFETHLARGLVLMIAAGCLVNSFLLDHTEGLLFAWMTGLLFAGLDQGRGARA